MDILYLLIPLSVLLGVLIGVALWWAVQSGQFDDLEGLHVLKSRVDAYAALLREHMRKEEALLEKARGFLTEAEWRNIADAFASNDDPLLGDHGPEEFRKLRLRIINRLPSKIRQSWWHGD